MSQIEHYTNRDGQKHEFVAYECRGTSDGERLTAWALMSSAFDSGEPYFCAFGLTEHGRLLEAEVGVDDGLVEQVYWDDASECDPVRGEDPDLQAHVRKLLERTASLTA
jgi:hypothetical protein